MADGDRRYNLTWHDWLNLESLVDISRVITVSALARENRARTSADFPEPGDLHASRYTRVSAPDGDLRLDMVPVSFDIVQPGQSLIDGEAGTPQA